MRTILHRGLICILLSRLVLGELAYAMPHAEAAAAGDDVASMATQRSHLPRPSHAPAPEPRSNSHCGEHVQARVGHEPATIESGVAHHTADMTHDMPHDMAGDMAGDGHVTQCCQAGECQCACAHWLFTPLPGIESHSHRARIPEAATAAGYHPTAGLFRPPA